MLNTFQHASNGPSTTSLTDDSRLKLVKFEAIIDLGDGRARRRHDFVLLKQNQIKTIFIDNISFINKLIIKSLHSAPYSVNKIGNKLYLEIERKASDTDFQF